jgi:hypothetical protein
MILLLLLPTYLLSVYLMYKYMRIAHSEKGIWCSLDIKTPELLIVFIPIINTLFVIIAWVFMYPIVKRERNYNNFFNVKR